MLAALSNSEAAETPSPTMALAIPSTGVEEEASCPICWEFLTDPVTLECGHNFCRACITNYCETWEKLGDLACPVCRCPIQKGNFQPNCQLANILEKLKRLPVKPQKETLCAKHNKELNLYCEEDGELICVSCERSTEHRAHTELLLEEAAQKYKERIKARLKFLKDKKENLMAEEQGSQEYLARLELEKQKTQSAFQQMHNFLEEKKCLVIAQLEDLEENVKTRLEENGTRLSEEISCLSNLIAKAEGESEQPAREFLQEIGSTLSSLSCSYEKKQERQLVKFSPDLEERLRTYSQNNCILKKAMETYEESLDQALKKLKHYPAKEGSLEDHGQHLPQAPKKVNVILDPDTAHPRLVLSEDLKSVKWESTYRMDLPDNPERFDLMPGVLGCEVFTSGNYWWEMEVDLKGEMWAVGVVRETVRRKGEIRHSPNEGIWVMGKTSHPWSPFRYWAFTSPEWTPLHLRREPKKIRVSLDYEKGTVEFFDVETDKSIFAFHSASFVGERIRPSFFLWQARLTCGI